MVSIAYHMLTSSAGRYTRVQGKDEFVVRRRDHFMLAACGHTKELTLRIDKKRNLVQDRDEHGRTLLYIASKSGFYDTCKLLLEKGASVNEAQKDGSTPLHGAAYFGHALVVGLLLQHGARSDIKNNWGNSALDESATPAIRSLIQTASADDISSPFAPVFPWFVIRCDVDSGTCDFRLDSSRLFYLRSFSLVGHTKCQQRGFCMDYEAKFTEVKQVR